MLYEKKKKDTFVAENAGNPLGEMDRRGRCGGDGKHQLE